MNRKITHALTAPVILAATLLLLPALVEAAIDGTPVTGSITLYAKSDYVSAGDGGSLALWGLTTGGRAQYPAPTLILNQGDTVTVNLVNELPAATSLVFPGHDVQSCTGAAGTLTCEAAASDGVTAGTASYTFTATDAGTYLYHSGTDPDVQVDMGLFGAIVVRPYGFDLLHPQAYGDPASAYEREYLFVLSEMDPVVHDLMLFYGSIASANAWTLGDYLSRYWFVNGRTAPDTMAERDVYWLPTQPVNAMVMMHPGDRVLMRVVSAGRDLHPFHHHGNHSRVIARDGRLLSSGAGAGTDLSYQVFTIQAVPGETYDAIFEWTGKGLGWDAYGDPTDPAYAHDCVDSRDNRSGLPPADGYDDITWEYCADHGKPFPVLMPEQQDLVFGGFWSGSPYLGALGALPPGEGGMNPVGGYTFMWHSHTEKELTNDDIFPGGLMAMLLVVPPGQPVVE